MKAEPSRRDFLFALPPAGLAAAALGYGVKSDGQPPAEVRARSFWQQQNDTAHPWWKLCLGWLPGDANGSETYASLSRRQPRRFPRSWTIRFCHVDNTFDADTLADAQRHAEQQVLSWLQAIIRELERQAFPTK